MVKNERLEGKTDSEKVNFAFLDHLVESLFSENPMFTEEEIRGETISMLVEGYENISSGNSFALLLLAFHPDIQKRAFKELFDIFGSNKRRSATFQDLQEMTYLEQIIKETLRLYPSLPFIPRGVEEELKIGDYILPVGSTILINLLSTQRNPKYFSSPHKFDPDNFSPEKKRAQHPFAFIPFSYGPRMCVGLKYAMFQMKGMLSTILRHYQLLPVGKLEDLERLEFVLSLAPVLGVNLKLIPRSYDV
uniref:Cytochrome P450 n=1 Tax=Timema monikensis TaxID=170555 RepID=A0A7R9HIX8_9NEOP|nr:unnamed protein product [Timema monikensis]